MFNYKSCEQLFAQQGHFDTVRAKKVDACDSLTIRGSTTGGGSGSLIFTLDDSSAISGNEFDFVGLSGNFISEGSIKIDDLRNLSAFVVGPVVEDDTHYGSSEYSTLTDAVTAASVLTNTVNNPAVIFIKPGTYTESALSIPNFVHLVGIQDENSENTNKAVNINTALTFQGTHLVAHVQISQNIVGVADNNLNFLHCSLNSFNYNGVTGTIHISMYQCELIGSSNNLPSTVDVLFRGEHITCRQSILIIGGSSSSIWNIKNLNIPDTTTQVQFASSSGIANIQNVKSQGSTYRINGGTVTIENFNIASTSGVTTLITCNNSTEASLIMKNGLLNCNRGLFSVTGSTTATCTLDNIFVIGADTSYNFINSNANATLYLKHIRSTKTNSDNGFVQVTGGSCFVDHCKFLGNVANAFNVANATLKVSNTICLVSTLASILFSTVSTTNTSTTFEHCNFAVDTSCIRMFDVTGSDSFTCTLNLNNCWVDLANVTDSGIEGNVGSVINIHSSSLVGHDNANHLINLNLTGAEITRPIIRVTNSYLEHVNANGTMLIFNNNSTGVLNSTEPFIIFHSNHLVNNGSSSTLMFFDNSNTAAAAIQNVYFFSNNYIDTNSASDYFQAATITNKDIITLNNTINDVNALISATVPSPITINTLSATLLAIVNQ